MSANDRGALDTAGTPYCCVCVSLDAKRTSTGTWYCLRCADELKKWVDKKRSAGEANHP